MKPKCKYVRSEKLADQYVNLIMEVQAKKNGFVFIKLQNLSNSK